MTINTINSTTNTRSYSHSKKLNGIYFILLIISIQIQHTKLHSLEDISVKLVTNLSHMQMEIGWNPINVNESSKIDITVTPKSKHCHQGVCIEDGVNMNTGHVLLPRHISSVLNTTPECSIDPGCKYHIKIESQDYNQSKNLMFQVPDCSDLIDYICTCRIKFLPELELNGKLLLNNSDNSNNNNIIVINWNLKKIHDNIKQLNTTGIQIITTIYNETNPLLKWGGRHELLATYKFPISNEQFLIATTAATTATSKNTNNNNNNDSNSSTKILSGSEIYKLKISPTSGTQFLIEGYIIDDRDCLGQKYKFRLVVPHNKKELQISSSSSNNFEFRLFLILIPIIIIIIMIILFISNYFYKYLKNTSKVNTTSNWMSIYRNVSTSVIHQISMEENLLYFDKENLDKNKTDMFEIPHNSIVISHEIGKGAFGRVFKATVQNLYGKNGLAIVAVKQLKKKPLPNEIEEFLNEIQTMKNVGYHENIVTILGCCTIKEPFMMIMEYVGQGDLLQYLRNIRKKHFITTTTPSKQHDSTAILNAITTSKMSSSSENNDIFYKYHNRNNNIRIPQDKYLELQFSSNSTRSDRSYIIQSEINPSTKLRPSVSETVYTILSEQTKSHQNNNDHDNDDDDDDLSKTSLNYTLDSNELHNFAIQIAKGMKHLEEKGITHRDLAARNILIDEHKTLKISDFGLSRSGIYVKPKDKAKLLPLRWLSIEAIYDNLYSSKSDVWAFGIVLWEIGTLGGFPYPTLSNYELLQFLCSGKRLDKPEICTKFLYDLMLKCWNENPNMRPSFADILNSLQGQTNKIYVNFNDIGPEYVFPPITEIISPSSSNN